MGYQEPHHHPTTNEKHRRVRQADDGYPNVVTGSPQRGAINQSQDIEYLKQGAEDQETGYEPPDGIIVGQDAGQRFALLRLS